MAMLSHHKVRSPARRFLYPSSLKRVVLVTSHGIAGKDLCGLDSALGRRAPLRSIQHQPESVRAPFPTPHNRFRLHHMFRAVQ